MSQDAEVGVKWSVQPGCCISHLTHGGMLVGGIVVDDGLDRLPTRSLRFDGVEEVDKLRVPMALHIATDDSAVEDVEDGKSPTVPG